MNWTLVDQVMVYCFSYWEAPAHTENIVHDQKPKQDNLSILSMQTLQRSVDTYWAERSRELILDSSALNQPKQPSWIHCNTIIGVIV